MNQHQPIPVLIPADALTALLDQLADRIADRLADKLAERLGLSAASRSIVLYTEREAAAILKMAPAQLATQRRLGKIGFTPGPRRSVRYRVTDLERYTRGLPPERPSQSK